jgi:hypothetical protein
MIRLLCPNCKRKLRVDESLPAAQCPACRTKFVVGAPVEPRRGSPRESQRESSAVEQRRRAPAPSPTRKSEEPIEVEAIDEPVEVEAVDEPADAVPVGPVKRGGDDVSGDEPPRRSRSESERRARRKKKRKKESAGGSFLDYLRQNSNAAMAIAMFSFPFLLVSAFGVSRLLPSAGPSIRGYDPAAEKKAAAELEKLFGVQIERDKDDPNHPVIGINAGQTDLTGKWTSFLEPLTKLRRLDLSNSKFNNVDIEHLAGLPELKDLNLANSRVTSGGMEPLGKLVNLERLNLGNCLIVEPSLIHLKGLTKLKKLNLGGTMAHGDTLQSFLPNLEISN